MPIIPQSFIHSLLDRVDIIDVVSARISLKKAGGNHLACCPFHQEKTPSFNVIASKQFYYCFGCGAHGDAISFVREFDGCDFVEAVTSLAQSTGLEMPKLEASQSPISKEAPSLYAYLENAAALYQKQLRVHPERETVIEYIKSRGLSGETVKRYGIGFVPAGWRFLKSTLVKKPSDEAAMVNLGLLTKNDRGQVYDRFRQRLMFPIRDTKGRTVGFGGRVLSSEDTPKYLNSPESELFQKGELLYGLYEYRKHTQRADFILVVEGYMDVAVLSEHGFHNAVATLGTATTASHLKTLFRQVDRVVFCFDGDRAGRDAALRATKVCLPLLHTPKHQVQFIFLPDKEDPDSYVRTQGAEAFEQLCKQAQPMLDYLWSHAKSGLTLTSIDGRAACIANIKPYLSLLPEGVYRETLVTTIASETGLSTEHILNACGCVEMPAPHEVVHKAAEGGDLISKAISVLLNQPELALEAPEIVLNGDDVRYAIWNRLLKLYRENPDLTIGGTLAMWDDTRVSRYLAHCAQIELPSKMEQAGFNELFHRLEDKLQTDRVAEIIEASKTRTLSLEEKELLRSGLAKRKAFSM